MSKRRSAPKPETIAGRLEFPVRKRREEAVTARLQAVGKKRGLTPEAVRRLRAKLERPKSVRRNEWRIGFRPEGQRITPTEYLKVRGSIECKPVPQGDEPLSADEAEKMAQQANAQELAYVQQLDDPAFRLPRSEAQRLYDIQHGRGEVFGGCVRPRVRSRTESKAVQRLAQRFYHEPFRAPGRVPFSYRRLIEQFVTAIESETGNFPCTRGSPEMELLYAALDLALFASGPPSRETLVKIISQRRRTASGDK